MIATAIPLLWALILLLAAAQGTLAFFRPQWAASLTLFLLPAYLIRIQGITPPVNIFEVLVLFFVFGVGLRYVSGKEHAAFSWSSARQWAPFALFTLGALFSAGAAFVHAQDIVPARMVLGAVKGFVLEPLVFVVALFSFTKRGTEVRTLLFSYIASAACVACAALLWGIGAVLLCGGNTAVRFCHAMTFDGRLRAFYGSPNELAMFIVPAAVLATGIWLVPRPGNLEYGIWKKMRWAILAALLAALFWTQSLGGIAAIAIGITWLFLTRFGKKLRSAVFTITILVSAGLPFFAVSFFHTLLLSSTRSSFVSRLMIWRTAIDLARTHWFFGIGPGAFQAGYVALQKNYPPYLEWAVPHPHNLFLSVWLFSGFLGLFGFLWAVLAAFRKGTSEGVSSIQRAALAAVIALVAYGAIDTPFWKNDTAIVFLLLLTACVLYGAEQRSGTSSESAKTI